MADTSVSSRDLSVLRDILDLSRPGRPEEPEELTYGLLDQLEVLLGCDGPSFQVLDSVHHSRSHAQGVEEGERFQMTAEELEADNRDPDPGMDVFWEYYWTSPCSLPERTGRPVVTSLRDVFSQREWAAHPVHTNYLPYVDEIVLGYPTGPGQSARILVPRLDGAAFGYRELTLVRLLEPHLKGLLTRTASAPRPYGPSSLTERQVQILRLVKQGLTNRAIGRDLGIREATVRKHLEHIYLRLGVLSRTRAVAVAFGDGIAG